MLPTSLRILGKLRCVYDTKMVRTLQLSYIYRKLHSKIIFKIIRYRTCGPWILWPCLSRFREYQVYSKVFQKYSRRFQHTNVEIYSRSTSEELKCYLYKNILNYIFKYWHLIASSLVVLVTIGDIKKSHGRETLLYKLCASSRLSEVRHSGCRC